MRLTIILITRATYRPMGDMVCMKGGAKPLERGRVGVWRSHSRCDAAVVKTPWCYLFRSIYTTADTILLYPYLPHIHRTLTSSSISNTVNLQTFYTRCN